MIDALVLAHQVPENWRAQAEIFSEIFFVFLVIGTVVGTVVVAYTLYHAYRYRERGVAADDEDGFEAPQLGELPRGQSGGKSRKLFLSFGLSAIIVISLVVYSYGLLLYVEQGPSSDVEQQGNAQEINVTGYQFGWEFEYENGHTEQNTLRVPQGEDQVIRLDVTSRDVWHAFGVTELRLKADAIPGQTDTTWFLADQEGTYLIECFELCGVGHSQMTGEIIVMPQDEYEQWYQENAAGGGDDGGGEEADSESPANESDDEGAGDEPADEPTETESPEEGGSGNETGSTDENDTTAETATQTPTPGGDA